MPIIKNKIGLLYVSFLLILFFAAIFCASDKSGIFLVVEFFLMTTLLFLFFQNHYIKQTPGVLPLLIISIYILIQVIPLPPGFVKLISPETFNIYNNAAGYENELAWMTLSLNTRAAINEFLRFSAYICGYILTVQLLLNRRRLKNTVIALIILVSFFAISAILHNPVLHTKAGSTGNAQFDFEQFVHYNHYYAYLIMIFPLVISFALLYKPEKKGRNLRDRLLEFFKSPHTNIYILLGFAIVLTASSVFLSLSICGILCLGLSIIILSRLLRKKNIGKLRVKLLLTTLLAICLILFGSKNSGFNVLNYQKTAKTHLTSHIVPPFADSAAIFADFPLTGTGFGTYRDIYKTYSTLPETVITEHAHNDFMEFATDGGIITIILFLWFLYEVISVSLKTFKKRKDLLVIYIYTGSMAGLLSIIIYSCFNSLAHNPPTGLYFFVMAGLLVASAHSNSKGKSKKQYLKPTSSVYRKLAVFTLSLLLLTTLIFNPGILSDKVYSYPFQIAKIEDSLLDYNAAKLYYKKALALNPVNSDYLEGFGELLIEKKEFQTAAKILKAAVKHDINNLKRYQTYREFIKTTFNNRNNFEKTIFELASRKEFPVNGLVVMTYNIGGTPDNTVRREETLKTIKRRGVPDLLFLQEVRNEKEVKDFAKALGLLYYCLAETDVAIIARYPLLNPKENFFPECEECRPAVTAEMIIDKTKYIVCSVHFPRINTAVNSLNMVKLIPENIWLYLKEFVIETACSKSADALISRLASFNPDRVIIGGDFNTTILSTAIRKMNHTYNDALACSTEYFSGTSKKLPSPLAPRIDYIFHSANIKSSEAFVVRQGPGDHFPVRAVLNCSSGES